MISERKKLFASYGGDYDNYIKNSGNALPLVGVIINNYEHEKRTRSRTFKSA